MKSGKISSNSPIAQGLLGKRVGDTVEIKVPAGSVNFEVVEIFMWKLLADAILFSD